MLTLESEGLAVVCLKETRYTSLIILAEWVSEDGTQKRETGLFVPELNCQNNLGISSLKEM